MKWKSLNPYILQLVITSIGYLGIPIILFATDIVQISVNNQYGNIGAVFIIAAICYYFLYLTSYFVPGISAILDMLTDNFVTSKMSYIESYVDRSNPYANSRKISADRKAPMDSHCMLKMVMGSNSGKSAYLMSYYHKLEKGKNYTVQYGKFSKVIISILSEQGEEMLLFDVK